MTPRPPKSTLFPYTTLFRSADHPAHGVLDLLPHLGRRLAPRVGHVGHDEHAQPVRPVELARRFDLHVLAQSVEADLPCAQRSEEHTSELQSQSNLVCRLLLE